MQKPTARELSAMLQRFVAGAPAQSLPIGRPRQQNAALSRRAFPRPRPVVARVRPTYASQERPPKKGSLGVVTAASAWGTAFCAPATETPNMNAADRVPLRQALRDDPLAPLHQDGSLDLQLLACSPPQAHNPQSKQAVPVATKSGFHHFGQFGASQLELPCYHASSNAGGQA